MKKGSLKQKLIIRNMATLLVVFVFILVIFLTLGYRSYTNQLEKTRRLLEDNLRDKGQLLVIDNALAFKTYVIDSSISTVKGIIVSNVRQDADIVFGAYVRAKDYQPWVWVTPDNPEGEVFGELTENEIAKWAVALKERPEDPKIVMEGKEETYYFAAPLYVEIEDLESETLNYITDKAGVVIYGLSTRSREEEFARENQLYKAELKTSVTMLGLLCLATLAMATYLTQRQAANITQPLGILTSAADTIAGGNYTIEVEVASGDEIETLAASFNQMVKDLDASYTDLKKTNAELEEAQSELEDLNKHLEEKVDQRTRQLKESESKFRTLFEESADAILLGSENSFLDCNPSMLKMMGCDSKDQFLKLSPDQISPESQPDGFNSSEKLHNLYSLARNGGSLQVEWLNQRVDGSEFYSEIVITSFPLNGEQVLHMVFRDITERKETEDKLKETQKKLVETAHSAGMAEIATGVLHNIGNILNSVNISTEEIALILKGSKLKGFLKANQIVEANADDLGAFFTTHPKGRLIPGYFNSLGEAIQDEHTQMGEEITALSDKISVMRDVISTQQSYAKATLYTEDIAVVDVVEDALKLQLASLKKQGVKIRKQYDVEPVGNVPKVKLVHVLTNLFKNGKEAMSSNDEQNRPQYMDIAIKQPDKNTVEVRVSDNGCGIKQDNLDKIFNHGFTTKSDGHGFGLHTCANFMTEMGGSLSAESEGPGHGSVFIVRFPLICKGPTQKPDEDQAESA